MAYRSKYLQGLSSEERKEKDQEAEKYRQGFFDRAAL